MTKKITIIFILFTIGLIVLFIYFVQKGNNIKNVQSTNPIQIAKAVYDQMKKEGIDMTNGPCLTNDLATDWVLDIAHNPRQPMDDLPQNQCSAFREGKAHHFVELDPNGNLIKVY